MNKKWTFVCWILKKLKYILVLLVCFGLNINVLTVSMRFSVIFCTYEHIFKYTLSFFDKSEMFRKHFKLSENIFLFCNMYKLQNSYFVSFVNCVIFGFWDIYIFIYIIYTRTVVLSYWRTILDYGLEVPSLAPQQGTSSEGRSSRPVAKHARSTSLALGQNMWPNMPSQIIVKIR